MKTIYEIKASVLEAIAKFAKEAGKAQQAKDREKFIYVSGLYAGLAAVMNEEFETDTPWLENHPAYKEALKCD